MKEPEFAACMAYVAHAIQKPLSVEAMKVYFDLLGDLPLEALQVACKRVVLEHRWATFPTVAELRQAASETIRGQVTELSPAEAWEMAWRTVGRIDPEVAGSSDRELEKVPAIVGAAIRACGVHAICYGREPIGVVRGHFLKVFEQLAARDRRQALLPAAIKGAVAEIGAKHGSLPAPVRDLIGKIGAHEQEKART